MSRPIRLIPALAFLLAGLVGCTHEEEAKKDTGPPPASVALPVKKAIVDYRTVSGETAAKDSVTVRARVSGYLKEVFFKEGDEVKTKQKLFEIDRRPYQAARDQAAADVARAKAAEQTAKFDMVRQNDLLPKNATSKAEYDQAVGKVGETAAQVKASEAALESADVNLGFTIVSSPIDGRISNYAVTIGNLVQADQTNLTTIMSVDPMYAYFNVDEHTVLQIKRLILEGKVKSANEEKMEVDMALADDVGFPWKGYINFVDNTIDPETRTLRLRGVFDNPKRVLLPKYFCRVRVALGPPQEKLMISDRAIGTEQGQKYVLVVGDKDVVEQKSIKIGPVMDGLRVIESGLTDSDRVIINGLQRVRPGLTVKPVVGPMLIERDRTTRQ
ncbi:MAG TPA: efflux RND transporter periplasmic adaptor subunit [Gemmataceae bacterium]|jgi:RND family efflux transporter MFP subunit|nr:efflux RND transporter periplasmic adaptor subunit [Gemmataceae bacterium]